MVASDKFAGLRVIGELCGVAEWDGEWVAAAAEQVGCDGELCVPVDVYFGDDTGCDEEESADFRSLPDGPPDGEFAAPADAEEVEGNGSESVSEGLGELVEVFEPLIGVGDVAAVLPVLAAASPVWEEYGVAAASEQGGGFLEPAAVGLDAVEIE